MCVCVCVCVISWSLCFSFVFKYACHNKSSAVWHRNRTCCRCRWPVGTLTTSNLPPSCFLAGHHSPHALKHRGEKRDPAGIPLTQKLPNRDTCKCFATLHASADVLRCASGTPPIPRLLNPLSYCKAGVPMHIFTWRQVRRHNVKKTFVRLFSKKKHVLKILLTVSQSSRAGMQSFFS